MVLADSAVVLERLPGLLRHGGHAVLADELVHVHRVRVGRVLDAGTGPQHALHLGAGGGDELPLPAVEVAAEPLVGDLGVGHPGAALERPQAPPLRLVGGGLDLLVQFLVHERVHARDEEAGHRRHRADGLIGLQPVLERLEVRVGHSLVLGQREQQRDVDVQAVLEALEDGRDPLPGARDLDEHVGAVDGREQPVRLGHRTTGVAGEVRRDLDADEAVLASAREVHGREHVARRAHVLDDQAIEDLRRLHALAGEREDGLVVLLAASDGLLEDRRIAGHPSQSVPVDHLLQPAALDERTVDVVEPGALTQTVELGEPALRGHGDHSPFVGAGPGTRLRRTSRGPRGPPAQQRRPSARPLWLSNSH